MTSKFDSLYEQLLNEAPMGIEGSIEDLASEITKKAEASPMSGHWKGLKRLPDMLNAVLDILKLVLPEKNPKTGKENTYNADIDNKEELKKAIHDSVQEVIQKKGYAEKFAGDRVNTMVLAKAAFEVAQNVQSTGNPPTQKQVTQALNKKLQAKPAAEIEAEASYYKAADIDSEDDTLVKAFNKLPSEGNLKWSEIVDKVGEEAANSLKKIGAIIEVVGGEEEEEDEEKEVPALEFDDEDEFTPSDFDSTVRQIGGAYSTKDFGDDISSERENWY